MSAVCHVSDEYAVIVICIFIGDGLDGDPFLLCLY